MKRSISRIKTLVKLYQYDLLKDDSYEDNFDDLLDELLGTLKNHECDEEFADALYNGVLTNIATIDRVISINLDNYLLERLSFIDRNILRIGTYELMYTDTPKQIVINEMINLSKAYSETDSDLSSKFNNSVLDKIAKFLKERKTNGGN